LGAVSTLEVRGQNVRDQRTKGFTLTIKERIYPVEQAKESAKKYTES
jgi:hypothetical protein